MTEKIIIQKRPPKSPAAAGILSGIFPGIGQIYNGQYTKGILFLVIFIGLITMQPHGGQPFQGLLLAGFYIFQIIEAAQSAKEINRLALVANGLEVSGQATAPKTLEAEVAKSAKSGSVFWGIVLMALGAIFLLSNFDVIDYDRIFNFWPVIVIVIGLKMIADYFAKKNN
ncbi:MAG: DUF5668 domain-containing protein [Candidatus Aminicenantes bacterium]|nr:DUF5668 domain-containing protein [Candidatus Aminicenantes bacterium]